MIEKAEAARAAAMEAGQYTAAINAIKEIGVLSGIRIERSERGTPGEFDFLENCSAEQLRDFLEDRLSVEALKAASEKLN